MKLKVLVDNNTYIDEYVLGEPALAFYLEHNNLKILFDTAYSDALITNAKNYQIDFNNLDYIILSHAHNDHTRGLHYLMDQFDLSNTTLLINPLILSARQDNEGLDIGMVDSIDEISSHMKVQYVDKSFEISDNLFLITNIGHYNSFENQHPVGKKYLDHNWVDDYLEEECALAYNNNQSIDIITGCSHRGICNLIEQTKLDLNLNNINSIIGGFHLFQVDNILKETTDCLKNNNIKHLFPCHCVSFQAKSYLNQYFNIQEVGVGFSIDYDQLK